MPFDKAQYDKNYAKTHITRKFVPFNDLVPEDVAILEHLATVGNVTAYVKRLIREDMAKTVNTIVWNMDEYPVGYKDPEAIKAAEGHKIQSVIVCGNIEVRLDADTKTILFVDRLY